MAKPRVIQRVAGIMESVAATLKSLAGDSTQSEAGTPMPARDPAGTPPKSYDFTQGINVHPTPRDWPGTATKLTAFKQLRALADFDVVRICIEDVKGQVLGMDRSIEVHPDFKDRAEALKPKIERANAFLDMPDPLAGADWRSWLSRVLEEVLVTDALTLFPRKTVGGEPIGLEQADGATIKPLVDDRARPPSDPTAVAYHQVINGIPEKGFTRQELWYMPRHRRADSPYGRSNVEMVLLTINTAIRHAMSDLAYHTDGTVPDGGLWACPAAWSPEQVTEFERLFKQSLQGSVAERVGMKMVPGGEGAGYHATKTREWKYEYLEYLARVVCWAFGVSPIPIAKITNRNVGEVQEMSSLESGVRPLAQFVALVINRYIRQELEMPELLFTWGSDETEDPALTIQRHKEMSAAGVLEIDEWRQANGMGPVLDGELQSQQLGPLIQTPAGPVFLRDLLDAREKQQGEDVSGMDPSLIQRAFLEVPIMRRDELRATIGLPPVGGEEGQEFVTIQGTDQTADQQKAKEDAAGIPPGEKTEEPGPEEEESDGPPPQLKALSSFRSRLCSDLTKLKKKARKTRKRPVAFISSVVPAVCKSRPLTDGHTLLMKLLKQGELDLPGKAQELEAQITEKILAWLQTQLPAALAWAQEQMPAVQADKLDADSLAVMAGYWLGSAELHKKIQQQGSEWVVLSESGKELGRHPSKKKALEHLAAIEANKLAKQDPLNFTALPGLVTELTPLIEALAELGASDATGALGITLGETPEAAALFAQERAAELVGMKWVDGELVINPNPRWAITETIRQDLQNKVTQSIQGGWSTDKLAAEIRDMMGSARAKTIARTETAFAYSEGAAQGYEEAGLEFVEILDGVGCLPDGHKAGAPKALPGKPGVIQYDREANGQVWTVAQFRAHKIGHPNCVRAAVPYFP